MKSNFMRTLAAVLVVLPITAAGQTASRLASDTRQSLAVVEDLVKRTPQWPTEAHKAVLLTYSLDGLSRSQALACNRHLSVIAANAATRRTRQDIAKDCPRLSQVLTASGL